MRKFFGVVFLFVGMFLLATPIMSCVDTKISASAEVEYPYDVYPTFEMLDAPVGLTFPFHLGGVMVAQNYELPVIPVDISLYINIGHDGDFSMTFYPLTYSSDGTFVSTDWVSPVVFDGNFTDGFIQYEIVDLTLNDGIDSPHLIDVPVYFIAEWIRGVDSNVDVPFLSFASDVYANSVFVNYYTDSLVIYIDLPVFRDGTIVQGDGARVTFAVRGAYDFISYKPLGNVGNLSGFVYTDLVGHVSPSVEYAYDYGYDLGYDEGWDDGFQEGFDEGEILGYDNGLEEGKYIGYNDGVKVALKDVTPWEMLIQQVDAFFDITMFGSSVTFGKILSIGFGVLMLGIAIKVFMGG